MEDTHLKQNESSDDRPLPMDLSLHYSLSTKSRQASDMKKFYKYFKIPGIGQLAGGLPNNNYFPFDTLEATAALPHRWTPTPNKPVDPRLTQLAQLSLSEQKTNKQSSRDSAAQSHIVVPKASNNDNVLRKIDLKSALQYGQAQGYPPLYDFLLRFTTENMHPNIPYKDGPEIVLTCGNTDGFSKTLEALTNVWSEERNPISEKEGLLVEEYAYMGAIQTARPRGMNIVPVHVDGEGMCARGHGGLWDVLENWDTSRGKRPHLIYTVTIGQNPTSGVLSLPRRREIYALCVKYDIIIIEDDPYWYLQYTPDNPFIRQHGHFVNPDLAQSPNWKSSGYAFLDSLAPSYLSIDHQGRVVRLDTFSKTIAPGCRLGWITTQPALAERLLRITETSTQQPSGFVQSIVAELILGSSDSSSTTSHASPSWQKDGWVRWLEGLRGNYERRMRTMCVIFDEGKDLVGTKQSPSRRHNRHYGSKANPSHKTTADKVDDDWSLITSTPMYSFNPPLGGMFIWLRLNFVSHPLWPLCSATLSATSYTVPATTHSVAGRRTGAQLAEALWIHLTTAPYRVLVSPGTVFAASDEIREKSAWEYFRICFAAVDEGEVEGLSHRFVEGVRAFWEIDEVEKVEGLLAGGGEGEGLVDLRGVC